MNNEIEFADFLKVSIQAGTIVGARLNEKARKPAYVMEIDFGETLGVRTTSAQLTDHYSVDDLPGMQIVAVTNFPPLRVAGVRSEVLVLGVVDDDGVVLLKPDRPVKNGLSVA